MNDERIKKSRIQSFGLQLPDEVSGLTGGFPPHP